MRVDPSSLHSNSVMQIPLPIPYTFRIGVTGHRNLYDLGLISSVVGKTLINLQQTLESVNADPYQPLITGPTLWRRFESHLVWKVKRALRFAKILKTEIPKERRTVMNWRVVSSLAKGADRIVARVAMDSLGASLEVVLPFSVEDYRLDFNTSADLAEFDELYNKADQKTNHAFEKEPAPTSREDGYRRAGEKVVESCEILIVVWDGQPERGKGGTAEIVEYALSLNRLVIWINSNDANQPACIVSSVRTENKEKSWLVSSHPIPQIAAGLSPQFVQLSEYNRVPAFSPDGFVQSYNDYRNILEKARVGANLPGEQLHPIFNFLLPHYAMADHLAIHYQKIHIRAATWLYRLAAIAVVVAIIQALYIPDHTGWIILEILALVSAVIWFRLSLCENWHEKWLNYRHLAERFRILTFSCLTRSEPSKKETDKNQTLPFYPGPEGWVVEAFDHVRSSLAPLKVSHRDFQSVKNFVLKGWIEDQTEFHSMIARKKALRAYKDHQFVGIMLGITLLAATLHMFDLVKIGFMENFIITMVVILPAFAASQHAIGGIHDFERIASRSERMEEILHRLERTISDAKTEEALQKGIQNAEDIMSTENHEWCVSLSFRRISLPV